MARTGKIARLPLWIRDELNRRLRGGGKARELAEWINSEPDAQVVLKALFAGRPVKEQNISQWRKGGYREWLAERAAFEDGIQLCGRVGDVVRECKVPVTENLTAYLSAQYAMALKNAAQQGAGSLDLKTLQAVCSDVVALRRRDQEAQWLDLEVKRQKLEGQRQDFYEEHSLIRWRERLDQEFKDTMHVLDKYRPALKEAVSVLLKELRRRNEPGFTIRTGDDSDPSPRENGNPAPNEEMDPGRSE